MKSYQYKRTSRASTDVHQPSARAVEALRESAKLDRARRIEQLTLSLGSRTEALAAFGLGTF